MQNQIIYIQPDSETEDVPWLEKVEAGIAAADAGDFVSEKEVEEVFERF